MERRRAEKTSDTGHNVVADGWAEAAHKPVLSRTYVYRQAFKAITL